MYRGYDRSGGEWLLQSLGKPAEGDAVFTECANAFGGWLKDKDDANGASLCLLPRYRVVPSEGGVTWTKIG